MDLSARNIITIVIALSLIWIFWRVFRGFFVVILLIGIIVLLVYIILRMKK